MSDDCPPYLHNITIKPTLPSDPGSVVVTFEWDVGPRPPDIVQIYALFGPSDGGLPPNLAGTLQPDAPMPIAIAITGANRNPLLHIGLAPRLAEGDGLAETMINVQGMQ